ncbi:MAG: hypothetical protein KDI30_12295 [Pseudomonadales bacterium]|nr:hypothetical protein [Pseudomonadales bacterium]
MRAVVPLTFLYLALFALPGASTTKISTINTYVVESEHDISDVRVPISAGIPLSCNGKLLDTLDGIVHYVITASEPNYCTIRFVFQKSKELSGRKFSILWMEMNSKGMAIPISTTTIKVD